MPHFPQVPSLIPSGSPPKQAVTEGSSPQRQALKGMSYEEQLASLVPPEQAPQTEEDAGWGLMDTVHTGLDVIGLIPLIGEVADAANALTYLAEGDHGNAALSAAAMVPVAGWAATGAKSVKTGMRVADAANTGAKASRRVTAESVAKTAARSLGPIPRPPGIPESWVAKPAKKGGGVKYSSPGNPHHSVRVMPGNPHSPFPSSRQPYVRHVRDGKSLDMNGRPVDVTTPEAHIPLEKFKWSE